MRSRAGSTASRRTTCSTAIRLPCRRGRPHRNGAVRPSPDGGLPSNPGALEMIRRLTAFVVLPLLLVVSAQAQDWKRKYPELVVAAAPAENPTAIVTRWTPVAAYLARELGVKVTIRP